MITFMSLWEAFDAGRVSSRDHGQLRAWSMATTILRAIHEQSIQHPIYAKDEARIAASADTVSEAHRCHRMSSENGSCFTKRSQVQGLFASDRMAWHKGSERLIWPASSRANALRSMWQLLLICRAIETLERVCEREKIHEGDRSRQRTGINKPVFWDMDISAPYSASFHSVGNADQECVDQTSLSARFRGKFQPFPVIHQKENEIDDHRLKQQDTDRIRERPC